MLRNLRCLAVGVALCAHAISAPALAESTAVTLTGSWQKIAPSGPSVDIQAISGQVFLTTVDWQPATGLAEPPAPAAAAVGQPMVLGEHRCLSLNGDLYAKAGGLGATIIIMDGVLCGSRGY